MTGGRPTVLSMTSAALEADGRALRIAHSFARAGCRSVVVEGVPSRSPGDFGVPVISFDTRAALPPPAPPAGTPAAPAPGWKTRARSWLRAGTGWGPADTLIFQLYRAGFLWKYAGAALRRLPPADLVYLHGFLFYPAAALRGAGRRVPLVYDAHDFYAGIRPPETLTSFDRDYVGPFLRRVEQRCCSAAAAVVTVSEGVAGMMADHYGVRPTILRNVQDPRLEPPAGDDAPPDDIRRRLGLGADDALVVVIGNCKPGQAMAELGQALRATARPVHVAFVGAGYEVHRPVMEALGVGARTHFVGPVPPHRLIPFVRTADAAAVIYVPLTSNYRAALPNGFFQAVSAGLPVLAGDGLPEVVGLVRRFELGLEVDLTQPAALAAALDRLGGDAGLRDRLRRGAERAAAELSWPVEERRLLDLVAPLIGSRP
ncbi:glycosyltransferase [Caenispirillum bisanense]|uniref:glycosyltransferase n=1 Tax=Caenispirillum bisanense TaxID=414052 RepID=UPI0031DD3DF8